MQKLVLFTVLIIALALITSNVVYADSKIVKSIDKALKKFSDKKKDKDLCYVLAGKESNLNGSIIWNNTKNDNCSGVTIPEPEPTPQPCVNGTIVNGTCIPNPTPVPCPTGTFYNTTSETCQPNPTPEPEPTPTNETKVIVVGDVADSSAGNAVYNAIKKQNADYVFVLGDLGYQSSLSWFKSTYGTSDKVYCVVGNHDAPEDGSNSIYTETLAFCGNSYWIKNDATLFVMLNTNDPNLSTLATKTGQVFSNSTIMQDVKAVHIMSHKPCAVPPNSHHPVEIKSFCDAIKSKIPSGLKVFYDQAHNHIMSESADGTYKQVGSGGKSHYTCGTSAAFPFCDNSHYGYLQYEIKPDGTTTSHFIDYNGVIRR